MLKHLKNMPANTLGLEAVGTVTHEDYRDVLIPLAEKAMKDGPIKMLYVAGEDFAGYALGAMWDDSAFGLKHWRDFSAIAVVTENMWLKGAISMFTPFFPCPVRVFDLAERDTAEQWLTETGNEEKAA